jgi:hypothetical protein
MTGTNLSLEMCWCRCPIECTPERLRHQWRGDTSTSPRLARVVQSVSVGRVKHGVAICFGPAVELHYSGIVLGGGQLNPSKREEVPSYEC